MKEILPKKYGWLIESALSLREVILDFKVEWQAYRPMLEGKMFAYIGTDNRDNDILTIKGDPSENRMMIEAHECVTEGYYMNKIHWVSILLDSLESLPREMVVDQLERSYQLALSKLSKKAQERIQNSLI